MRVHVDGTGTSRSPAPLKSIAGAFYAFPHLRSRVEIIHRHRLAVPHRRRSTTSSAKCVSHREDRVESWTPPRRESFLLTERANARPLGKETAHGAVTTNPDALCSDCLKFLSVLYHRPVSLYSLFLRFYVLFRRTRCAGYIAGEMPLARVPSSERSREAGISRYKGKRFTAKWIDYSVSRSRERNDC